MKRILLVTDEELDLLLDWFAAACEDDSSFDADDPASVELREKIASARLR